MRNYPCDQCEWMRGRRGGGTWVTVMEFTPSFRTKRELAQHRIILHGDMECPICPWRFETRSGRQVHLDRYHGLKGAQAKLATQGRNGFLPRAG